MSRKYAIIVAAGKGTRMGTDISKQFLLLAGKPVLMYSLEAFYKYDPNIQIILVLPSAQKEYWCTLCRKHSFHIYHKIVDGGETRFHSVQNGLRLVNEDALVAIHDGVRPMVSSQLIEQLFNAAAEKKAAYPVVPIEDTIRRIIINGSSKMMDRSKFCLVQTPQVFTSRILSHAYQAEYSEKFTDDVSVVETRRICKPVMVEGSKENIKITTPIDMIIAEAMIKSW